MEKTNVFNGRVLFSKRWLVFLLNVGVSFFYSSHLYAAVADVTVSDVTTRAFSVVWVSDGPITAATVRVFSDANGDTEITGDLTVNLVSPAAALTNGIAKVDVTGLAPNTIYYLETETTDAMGAIVFPPSTNPLIQVHTATSTTRENASGGPITNDLIHHEILEPDVLTGSQGTLLMLKIPGVSTFPLTAFVGEGFSVPEAVVDLNNLFDDASSISADIAGNTVMEITEFRGLLCNIEDQKRKLLRRVPIHEESPPITELELPADCFSPGGTPVDFNCDSRIGLEDLGALAARFGLEQPDCRFNADFDLNADGRIGLFDLGALAAAFGTTE